MVESRSTKNRRKVAIIGSGLAGLTAAHLLSNDAGVEVHIFEKADRIGMDAASIDVVGNDGKTYRVDSPMRAVQGGYYRNLLKLYHKLGIELERTDFDYSFMKLRHKPPNAGLRQKIEKETSFIYNGGNGLSAKPFGMPVRSQSGDVVSRTYAFFSDFALVLFYALSYIYLLLFCAYHKATGHLERGSEHWVASTTFKQFLGKSRLPEAFSRDILIPLFSCVATCSPEELLEYPATEFLEYIIATFGSLHYVVKGGVRTAVNKLLSRRPSEDIHLDSQLVSLKRSVTETGKLELEDSNGNKSAFDHVIFATQANQALFLMRTYYKCLLDQPDKDQAQLSHAKKRLDALGKFRYTQSVVVNHYDSRYTLSVHHADMRMLNLATWHSPSPLTEEKFDASKQVPQDFVMATHNLSHKFPQLLSPTGEALLQTTNPTVSLDEAKIVSKKTFERAIVTMESKRVLPNFIDCTSPESFQGQDGIWFVGAWAAEGIPLLEGCVVSAERVVKALEVAAKSS